MERRWVEHQRTWEKEMQVSCWLSVYCWILKTVGLLLQMHKKTRCVFSYLFLKILQNQWNYQTLLYKKINWCLTKTWWRSVGGTILDTRWWTLKWVSLKIVLFPSPQEAKAMATPWNSISWIVCCFVEFVEFIRKEACNEAKIALGYAQHFWMEFV